MLCSSIKSTFHATTDPVTMVRLTCAGEKPELM
jgi:hypothetical protein